MRQHRLVGGDDMLAGFKSPGHKIERNPFLAADHLDDNIDIIALGDLRRFICPVDPGNVKAAIGIARAGTDNIDPEVASGDGGKRVAMMADLAGDFTAHDAEAGNSDPQRGGRFLGFVRRHGNLSLGLNSSNRCNGCAANIQAAATLPSGSLDDDRAVPRLLLDHAVRRGRFGQREDLCDRSFQHTAFQHVIHHTGVGRGLFVADQIDKDGRQGEVLEHHLQELLQLLFSSYPELSLLVLGQLRTQTQVHLQVIKLI